MATFKAGDYVHLTGSLFYGKIVEVGEGTLTGRQMCRVVYHLHTERGEWIFSDVLELCEKRLVPVSIQNVPVSNE